MSTTQKKNYSIKITILLNNLIAFNINYNSVTYIRHYEHSYPKIIKRQSSLLFAYPLLCSLRNFNS